MLDVGQQLDLIKHELSGDLEPDVNDYAGACTAMLFVIDGHWDEFAAWNDRTLGVDAGDGYRNAFLAAMARLDECYKRLSDEC